MQRSLVMSGHRVQVCPFVLIEVMETCCVQVVYDAIAGSGDFYHSPVDPAVRSLMNIPFTIPSKPELEKTFVSEAAARGLVRPAAVIRCSA